ncbi:DUF6745 domain-containing protein [Micromonospora sp. HM5-17]|uniref:DUF6745 domain-containing protein n=1 Tax=Micromonospora sp. HM5-17 TaxID=2487710 RepID=UPI001F175855|nr:hypothetical protein [Micromonospora sp. HM5-17]
MTAPARPRAARESLPPHSLSELVAEYWRHAVEIRREWLEHGLSTRPADRTVAEEIVAGIYARHSRHRPHVHWVASPRQALPLLDGLPTHEILQRWVMARRPPGPPPLASDIAAGLSRLRSALDACISDLDTGAPRLVRRNGQPWPVLPPLEALAKGVPLREVLRQGVRDALRTSLADGFYLPVRAALAGHGPLPVAWYGQQEAHWIAYYDALRRLGLARYRPSDNDQLDDWATLARSCGWWWPGERVCVMVDRPAVLETEPIPDGWHEQVRLRRGGRPPVEYRDGWQPPIATARPSSSRDRP